MVGMCETCEMEGGQSGSCDRGGYGGWKAAAESVVYLEKGGGAADISHTER